ncbi:hypothetical protein [Acrocarpospora catenulata]|uniref:hypothetical protein n=1 Tax=Acrocarpospora catenulata TaxID=2836182 RepID=UPI001BD9B61A|nr:hypothetical protein [Acrocarpospora catenulata]
MSYVVALILAGLGSAAVYAVLTFVCAMVAMFSKDERRSDIAQKLFDTLMRRGKGPEAAPELPRGTGDASSPPDEAPPSNEALV